MTILLHYPRKDNRFDLVFDIEANGLFDTVTQVHCIGIKCLNNPDEETQIYHGERIHEALHRLAQARTIVGHNILDYDLKTLLKLYPDEVSVFQSTPLDTLVWSRLLYPDRPGGHSLKSWGKRLGFEKGSLEEDSDDGEVIDIWDRLTPEMLEYCKTDVDLTRMVVDQLVQESQYTQDFLDSWCIHKQLMEIPCQ